MKIDSLDRKILNTLQSNGRITNAQLAEDVGISPPGMLERVKRLEKGGVIKRFVAIVDPEKIGKGTLAIVTVSLAVHELSSMDRFAEEINKLEDVLECYHISGGNDFLLKVAVKDIQQYQTFVVDKLTRIEGVNRINTSFILATVKYDTKIHVEKGKQ